MRMIGIHTPEGEHERDLAALRKKIADERFDFPIVVDNERGNWKTWGTGIWPSVYLIDRRGYIRYWWYGELKWNGTDGERVMRSRIEELLAEPG